MTQPITFPTEFFLKYELLNLGCTCECGLSAGVSDYDSYCLVYKQSLDHAKCIDDLNSHKLPFEFLTPS